MRKFMTYCVTMVVCLSCLAGCGKAGGNNMGKQSENVMEEENSKSTVGTSIFGVSNSNASESEKKELEIIDSGYFESSRIGETTYLDAYAKVHNPNDAKMAEYPKLTVTVKSSDETILATDYDTCSYIMPGDTVVMIESIGVSNYTDDCKIELNVTTDYINVTDSIRKENSLSSDFSFTNVSEISERYSNKITGEIMNNFSADVDNVTLTVSLLKDGKIVYVDTTYVHDLKIGQNTPFEYKYYSTDWPDHDSIKLLAQQW